MEGSVESSARSRASVKLREALGADPLWRRGQALHPQDLRAFRLLESLPDGDLSLIFSKLSVIPMYRGQAGVQSSVEDVRFTLVLAGTYRVVALSAEGARVTLRSLGPGDYFGEVGILGKIAPANWIAEPEQPGDVLTMSRTDFLEVLERIPDLRTQLLSDVVAQAARWAERIFELAALSPRARLLSHLLRLAEQRKGSGRRVVLGSAPTHDTLASEIGITREAVSRLMKSLRTEGLLISGRREIILTDLPRLRALVRREID